MSLEQLDSLRENIKIELDLCISADTPYVCLNIKTPEGYQKIEDLIIQKILTEQITIGQAIIAVETDLNPNSYDQ